MGDIIHVIIPVAVGIVMLIAGFLAGVFYRKRIGEAEIGSAEAEAKRIVDEAVKEGETKKKEKLLEAKEEIVKANKEFDREVKERRNELTKLEHRCVSREEAIDKRTEQIERREAALEKKIKENDEKIAEIAGIKQQAIRKLEEISGYTAEQAKREIIDQIEEDARYEAAEGLIEIERRFKEEADEKAKSIISLAISRLASEYVAEATVSVVPLPSDDMKGRIIGREGRNVRTVETLTGVDLIIDDTPEAITISSFDPVRREVARLALEKLIADGRIHPTRIEEMVEKAKKEVETSIKQAGDKAIFETGVHGINQELVKLLGRLRYRTSYGQNVLAHSIEVSLIAGMIADEIGADSTLAKRAGQIGRASCRERV